MGIQMLYQQKINQKDLQISLLSEHLRHSRFGFLGVQALFISAVAGLIWYQVESSLAIRWIAAMSLLGLIYSLYMWRAVARKAFIDEPARILVMLILGAVSTGGAWGLSVIWLEPLLPDMAFYFLILLVTVMVVTATAVISVVRIVYQAWLLSTLIPIACLLAWHFDDRSYNLLMSLSLLGLCILLLFVGSWLSQSFLDMTQSSLERQSMSEEFATLSENLRVRNFQLEQLRDQLADIATIDELTGLRNRRGGNQMLEDELSRAKRAGAPLTVIAIDVDCFKQYNDTYGHPSGDRVLQQVAEILVSVTGRAGDVAVRMGGEEFLLLSPGTTEVEAMEVAGLVKQRLEAAAIAHASSSVASHVTVSLGVVSCVPEMRTTIEDMIHAADKALYDSKGNGRNRATLGNPPV